EMSMKSRSKMSKARPVRKRRTAREDADLRTGSLAPHALVPATLEASIGAEVRRLRKSLDLTVAELGVGAGISAGMLSKIENGAISPSLATLKALAQALNVPISALFAETEERRDCSFVKAGRGVRIERRGTKAGSQVMVGMTTSTLRLRPARTVSGTRAVRPRWVTTATHSPADARRGMRTATTGPLVFPWAIVRGA